MIPVKAGILGFGRVAESGHLPRMRDCGLYEVVGVCDITPSRRAAAEAEGLRATPEIDDFLSWDIELVVITTHSSAHYAGALSAAEAGKHMFIEKPMAVTAKEAEEMAGAARSANVVLSVCHNRRYAPEYRLVKAAVQDGVLGELVTVENRTMEPQTAVGYGVPEFHQEWRITSAAGGGTLLDFGPHWIDQVLDLMAGEKVVQVFGDVRHVKWGDADDFFRIDMIFESGVRAAVGKCDVAYYAPPDKWLIVGAKATLHGPVSEGEDKRVVVNGPDGQMIWSKMTPNQDLHVNLAEHIRDGAPLIITPEHALRVMKVIQAGVDSSNAGKSVDVRI